MLHTIAHNGFHGPTTVSFRGPLPSLLNRCVPVSARVARRLNRAVCGVRGCACSERLAFQLSSAGDGWFVAMPNVLCVRDCRRLL